METKMSYEELEELNQSLAVSNDYLTKELNKLRSKYEPHGNPYDDIEYSIEECSPELSYNELKADINALKASLKYASIGITMLWGFIVTIFRSGINIAQAIIYPLSSILLGIGLYLILRVLGVASARKESKMDGKLFEKIKLSTLICIVLPIAVTLIWWLYPDILYGIVFGTSE